MIGGGFQFDSRSHYQIFTFYSLLLFPLYVQTNRDTVISNKLQSFPNSYQPEQLIYVFFPVYLTMLSVGDLYDVKRESMQPHC